MPLTSEEVKAVEGNRNFYGDKNRQGFPPTKDVMSLIAIIDRLSARVEELETSRDIWKNGCLNRKSLAETEELQSRLDAIEKAIEHFKSHCERTDSGLIVSEADLDRLIGGEKE